MSTHGSNLRTLLNSAIQRGLFKDAESVQRASASVEYFLKMEENITCFESKVFGENNSERLMPSKSTLDFDYSEAERKAKEEMDRKNLPPFVRHPNH